MLAAIDEALLRLLRVPNSSQLERDTCAIVGTPVSAPQLALLGALAERAQAVRVTDLARKLGLGSSTVSRQVQELVEGGFAEAGPLPGDRRTRAFELTGRGRELLEEVTRARRAFLGRLLSDCSEEDVAHLARLLPRLAAAFAAHRAGSGDDRPPGGGRAPASPSRRRSGGGRPGADLADAEHHPHRTRQGTR